MKCSKRIKDILLSWRIGDYLRQFSIVAAGVIVTFWGSDLISQHATQKEIRSVMLLIVQELQANQAELRQIKADIDGDVRMSLLLREADLNLDRIPVDTVSKYQAFFSSTSDMIVTADALEVLKNSSLMQYIPDKAMLQDLLWVYNKMHEVQNGIRSYYDLKYRIITSSLGKMTQEQAIDYTIRAQGNAHRRFLLQQPDFIFFTAAVEYFTDWREIDRLDEKMSRMIALLQKSYAR